MPVKTIRSRIPLPTNLPKIKLDKQLYFPLIVVAAFVLGLVIGVLYTEVQYLKKGVSTATTGTNTQTAATPAPVTVDIKTIKDLFNDKNIHFGDANRKNLFVMVSDPSCPFCHLATGLDPELNSTSGDQFKLVSQGGSYVAPVEEMRKLVDSGDASFVWIYSPGHGNGELGTRALYCGYEQGKFWEVHDKLMSDGGYKLMNDQVQNDKSKTQQVVDFIGNVVDDQKLSSCMTGGKYDDRLTSDASLASSLGVQGTPGFFINENRIDGADNWTNMTSFLK